MSLCLPAWTRRLAGPLLSILALTAGVLALGGAQAGAAPAQSESLVPFVVGGQEAAISQFPWQVFVLVTDAGEKRTESCGGSILDATHILTAAHCVDHEGTTTSYPASEVTVIAGASEVVPDMRVVPATAQERSVKSFRVHPYYAPQPETKDDVAVLELTAPLQLSAAKSTQAITLVATGATPAPGTPLSVSGYGKQLGAETAQPNGKLYSTSLSAISSDACRSYVGVNSAVLLCAQSATSSTCQGDSGGPLTEGSPAVQVGIVDFGAHECPAGQPGGFSNVAAPEVRAFIEGSETPPVAPRPSSAPVLRATSASPVDFSPLTCEAGVWNGSPSFTYNFQADTASAQLLQGAVSNIFTSPSSIVGLPVVCVVQASNAGGVSTFRSGTTPPIAADAAPPVASITALRCHLQTCSLSLAASDPNGVALSLQPTAAYSVLTKCPKPKKKPKKGRKKPVCHRRLTLELPVKALTPPVFEASASRLPYGKPISFSVLAMNVAGVRQTASPTIRAITLHKPKPKPKKKKKGKKR
jgi:hypothetical protein